MPSASAGSVSRLAVYPRLAAVAHAHLFYSWATDLVHSTPAEDDDAAADPSWVP